MKQLTLSFIFLIALVSASDAAVLTVSNNANSPGQYTGLQAAITAASDGDSIYISGSTSGYGAISINKSLTLIGTGYNPAKQIPLVSIIGNISLDTVNSVSGASGTKLIGLNMSTLYDNYGAKHITLERNYCSSSLNLASASSYYIIRNNFLTQTSTLNNASNVLFENNIGSNTSINLSNQNSVIINHNVFLAPLGSNQYCMSQVSSAIITNNIFWGTSPMNSNVIGNTFNNNLTYQTINNTLPGASNTGTGNLPGVNPQFVNAPNPVIDFSYDYNVSAASPAHNAGTDGTDLGVFGGASSMPDLTGMPAIPQVYQMNINTPVIPPGGSLDVDFKARKNN